MVDEIVDQKQSYSERVILCVTMWNYDFVFSFFIASKKQTKQTIHHCVSWMLFSDVFGRCYPSMFVAPIAIWGNTPRKPKFNLGFESGAPLIRGRR